MDTSVRDRWLENAERRMAGAGFRSGAARTAVIELLAREGQCLLSAQEISDRLRARGRASTASVYRTLDELFELGLVRRVDVQNGGAQYEIADPAGHHHHFVDDGDGEVRPFTDAALEDAIRATARRLDVELTGHEVILRGRSRAAR